MSKPDNSIIKTDPFSSLLWHRVSATIVNIRCIPKSSANPLSIVNAIIKGVTLSLSPDYDAEMPDIIFHIRGKKHSLKMKEAETIPVDILFFRIEKEFISKWTDALKQYISDPITGKNFDIIDIGDIEERSYKKLLSEIGEVPEEGELCLEFLTPFPFRVEKGRQRTYISKNTFINSLKRRFSKLFGKNILYTSATDDFFLLPYYWNYTEFRHPSKSQAGKTQYINGCIGKLYIKGRFKDILTFLILGSELHCGTKFSNAQGYYLLHKDSPAYFERYFPNKKALRSIIRTVIEEYDNALQSLSEQNALPFIEEEYTEKLFRQIKMKTYIPTPNTAFAIKKKDGMERMIEQLGYQDLIVQQYLLKTITKVFDRVFEKESIGFRRGMSREKIIEMIQSAIAGGYQYIIESDIENFFPSVDLGILLNLITLYLPKSDTCMKDLIKKSIMTGYSLNGTYHERVKGLAQGSPLSPIMANLYLDSFDEHIKDWGVKIIRYADDFIILTRTREEAESILSRTEALLSELGLKIKGEKTSIKHIKEGFHFLGFTFQGSERVEEPEDIYKRLKKPLYITEPYLFLSINSDALDIFKNRKVIETIPLRRLSEIMVMEKAVFSTALLRKCADYNIPLTINLNTGYYVTTVKPDSKKYYDISFEHAKKYNSLSETELLYTAKSFAEWKIKNYISLFKQKYIKEQNKFIHKLEIALQELNRSGDINQIRGIEGWIAKEIYQRLNTLIDNSIFYIKTRQRRNPDMINSLLNLGYYLLFSKINATLRGMGLNPYLGFLHSPNDNYESLVCDIEELFRARIDRFVIRLINLKIIKEEDFHETERGYYLNKEAIKRYLSHFEAEIDKKNSKNTLCLKENIYLQALVIKRWVLENASLSFYTWIV